MFDIFGEVKKHIKTSGYREPCVTSSVLQTLKLTMLITIFCCVLVTARQYIGQNINCITGFGGSEHKAIENYCFISGTFTVPGLTSQNSAHPGVGSLPVNIPPNPREDPSGQVVLHAYYQWVPLVLVLQAAVYYLPELLWKQVDHGFFITTLCKLNEVHINDGAAQTHIMASASYMARTLRQHNRYAVSFLLVELFGVAISIANLFITNAFLGGEFFSYGPDAFRYLNTPAYDYSSPLNQIFPKVGKCTWHKYGTSGTLQTFDAMCVLPLNIVNEKTYILLWFTFFLTVGVASLFFLWHIVLFLVPGVRDTFLLNLNMKPITKQRVDNILKKGSLGDWFLMWNYKSHMMYFGDWTKKVNELMNE